jgi:hypothetical protein
MDFAGGCQDSYYYLMNCGFFNQHTPYNTLFQRPLMHIEPRVIFEKLPRE